MKQQRKKPYQPWHRFTVELDENMNASALMRFFKASAYMRKIVVLSVHPPVLSFELPDSLDPETVLAKWAANDCKPKALLVLERGP